MLLPILCAICNVVEAKDKAQISDLPQKSNAKVKIANGLVYTSSIVDTLAAVSSLALGIIGSLGLLPLSAPLSAALLGVGVTGVSLILFITKCLSLDKQRQKLFDSSSFLRILISMSLLSSGGVIILFHLQVALPITYFLVGAGGTGAVSYISTDVVASHIAMAEKEDELGYHVKMTNVQITPNRPFYS